MTISDLQDFVRNGTGASTPRLRLLRIATYAPGMIAIIILHVVCFFPFLAAYLWHMAERYVREGNGKTDEGKVRLLGGPYDGRTSLRSPFKGGSRTIMHGDMQCTYVLTVSGKEAIYEEDT